MTSGMTSAKRPSPAGRLAAALAAAMFLAGAVWRGVIAWQHHLQALATVNDPSMRELEEVSAAFEAGGALALLAHAILLAVATRRRFAFHAGQALATAALCGLTLAGTFNGVTPLNLPGILPLTVVVGTVFVSLLLSFAWLSAYVGAVVGCVLAWYAAVPVSDAFACLAVTVFCVIYVFIGAGLGRGMARFSARRAA